MKAIERSLDSCLTSGNAELAANVQEVASVLDDTGNVDDIPECNTEDDMGFDEGMAWGDDVSVRVEHAIADADTLDVDDDEHDDEVVLHSETTVTSVPSFEWWQGIARVAEQYGVRHSELREMSRQPRSEIEKWFQALTQPDSGGASSSGAAGSSGRANDAGVSRPSGSRST